MNEAMEKVLYGLLIIFIFYVIFELVRKIVGGSWGFEELTIALLVANLGYTFHLKESIGKQALQFQNGVASIEAKIENHLHWHQGKGHGN